MVYGIDGTSLGSSISVHIGGCEEFTLKRGEGRTLDLDDGLYTMVIRAPLVKRTVQLRLEGDDSFYITGDYATGGAIIANRSERKFTYYPKFRLWSLTSLVTALGINMALLVMGIMGIVPHEVSSLGILIFAGTLAASLGCTLALNSVPIIRE